MTRILAAIFISLFSIKSAAQNQYMDSLKKVLAATSKPIEQFTLINQILEANNAVTIPDTSAGVQLYRIAQQLKNDSLLAISLNVIGNDFRNKSEYPTALGYFFKAIPLAEKAKDKRRISSLYFDMSQCYGNLNNTAESFKYAKYGGDNLPDKSSPWYDRMVQQFYWRMASTYLQINQPDSALVYIHQLEGVNRG